MFFLRSLLPDESYLNSIHHGLVGLCLGFTFCFHSVSIFFGAKKNTLIFFWFKEKTGLDCYKMKFNGKSLKDDETLRQHKVEDGGTITTEPEFHGQYLPMGVQPSMEKKRKAEEELDKVVELAPEVAFDGEIL